MPDEKHHTARSLLAGENPLIAYWDISLKLCREKKKGCLMLERGKEKKWKLFKLFVCPDCFLLVSTWSKSDFHGFCCWARMGFPQLGSCKDLFTLIPKKCLAPVRLKQGWMSCWQAPARSKACPHEGPGSWAAVTCDSSSCVGSAHRHWWGDVTHEHTNILISKDTELTRLF